jgi:hypothetical protein
VSNPNPSPAPRSSFWQRLPRSTRTGIVLTAVLAVISLVSGGFWSMMLMIALVVLVTAAYGWTTRRRTWLRLPAKRATAAAAFGIAFAVLLGSSSAYGAAHPEQQRPASLAAAVASAAPSRSASHTATPTPTPTPTPVVTTELVTEDAVIPYGSTTVDSATLAQGTDQVTTAGVNGVTTTTFEVTKTDGVETGRHQVKQEVTTPPTAQVTTHGTYVAPAPAPVAPAAPAPVQQAPAPAVPASGPTALCNDGSTSFSAHRQGTCSHHGGVAVWY